MPPIPREEHEQTPREERLNSLSHGFGLLLAIVAAPVLILRAVDSGNPAGIVGASVFAFTMVLLYLCSTVYHGLKPGKAKRLFLILDHSAIFLFIAGSYTPYTLTAMSGPWGWSLFGVVWAMALAGILLKACCGARYPVFSMGLYLTMGWLSLIAIYPLWTRVPAHGLACLFAGGFTYTAGVAYFLTDHRREYNHLRWHYFVLLGTAFHFLAVWAYVI